MRTIVEGKKIILVGDTTNTRGKVLDGSSLANHVQKIARKGDSFFALCVK